MIQLGVLVFGCNGVYVLWRLGVDALKCLCYSGFSRCIFVYIGEVQCSLV